MNHEEKDKVSSVAWYKLAELVDRGEKEKVLNLYRLLSHSFSDRAYALQVEGDILWAFEDNAALEKYEQAAYLYRREKNIIAAIAVNEHVLTLDAQNYEALFLLLELYATLDWYEKFTERFLVMLRFFELKKISRDQIEEVLVRLFQVFDEHENAASRHLTVESFILLLRTEKRELAVRAEALFRAQQ